MKNWGLPRHFELGERCHFADGQNSDKNDQSNIPRPALSYTRHSRESGNPLCSGPTMDPRFRGGHVAEDFLFLWVGRLAES